MDQEAVEKLKKEVLLGRYNVVSISIFNFSKKKASWDTKQGKFYPSTQKASF